MTQEKKHDLSTNEFYFKMKKEMLLLSIRCFNEALHLANSWENELWLHYYMLGKASEKLEQPPDEYLEFYQKVILFVKGYLFVLIIYDYFFYFFYLLSFSNKFLISNQNFIFQVTARTL